MFKEEILKLIAEGIKPKRIAEIVGCSVTTVYKYTIHHPPKHDSEGRRYCWNCKQYKSPEEFNQDKWAKDGLQHVCKECNIQRSRAYRKRILDRKHESAKIEPTNNNQGETL